MHAVLLLCVIGWCLCQPEILRPLLKYDFADRALADGGEHPGKRIPLQWGVDPHIAQPLSDRLSVPVQEGVSLQSPGNINWLKQAILHRHNELYLKVQVVLPRVNLEGEFCLFCLLKNSGITRRQTSPRAPPSRCSDLNFGLLIKNRFLRLSLLTSQANPASPMDVDRYAFVDASMVGQPVTVEAHFNGTHRRLRVNGKLAYSDAFPARIDVSNWDEHMRLFIGTVQPSPYARKETIGLQTAELWTVNPRHAGSVARVGHLAKQQPKLPSMHPAPSLGTPLSDVSMCVFKDRELHKQGFPVMLSNRTFIRLSTHDACLPESCVATSQRLQLSRVTLCVSDTPRVMLPSKEPKSCREAGGHEYVLFDVGRDSFPVMTGTRWQTSVEPGPDNCTASALVSFVPGRDVYNIAQRRLYLSVRGWLYEPSKTHGLQADGARRVGGMLALSAFDDQCPAGTVFDGLWFNECVTPTAAWAVFVFVELRLLVVVVAVVFLFLLATGACSYSAYANARPHHVAAHDHTYAQLRDMRERVDALNESDDDGFERDEEEIDDEFENDSEPVGRQGPTTPKKRTATTQGRY